MQHFNSGIELYVTNHLFMMVLVLLRSIITVFAEGFVFKKGSSAET